VGRHCGEELNWVLGKVQKKRARAKKNHRRELRRQELLFSNPPASDRGIKNRKQGKHKA
jgi:hypothetical protein